MKYNFPEVKFVWNSTLELQLEHIRSEIGEAIRECMDGHLGDMDIEVMDIIHSCETLLRMREAKGVDLKATKALVVQKNAYRGYYAKEL